VAPTKPKSQLKPGMGVMCMVWIDEGGRFSGFWDQEAKLTITKDEGGKVNFFLSWEPGCWVL